MNDSIVFLYFVFLIIILGIIYTSIEVLLRKRKNQSFRKSFSKARPFIKGRKNFFVFFEVLIIILFLISMGAQPWSYPSIPISFILMLYFLIFYSIRGIEEWLFKREEKEYQHTWLAASFIIVLLVLIFFFMISKVNMVPLTG